MGSFVGSFIPPPVVEEEHVGSPVAITGAAIGATKEGL